MLWLMAMSMAQAQAGFTALDAWTACAGDHARLWTRSSEDADTVARAALGACLAEEEAARKEVIANSQARGLNEAMARDGAPATMRQYKAGITEKLLAVIVSARMPK